MNAALHESEAIDRVHGIDLLDTAITSEFHRGLTDLPTVYAPYFIHSLPLLLSKPSRYKKQWFLIIRSARESSTSYLPPDHFSTTASLRKWIGLTPLLQ